MATRHDLEAAIRAVLEGFPEIAAAWLFGSVARGAARDDSDLDVGVVYARGDRDSHDRLAPAVAAALSRATGVERIDVVDLAAQGPIFAHRVLCDGVLVYEADYARRVDFASDTLVRAFDFMPTYRIATSGKAAALRKWLEAHYDV